MTSSHTHPAGFVSVRLISECLVGRIYARVIKCPPSGANSMTEEFHHSSEDELVLWPEARLRTVL